MWWYQDYFFFVLVREDEDGGFIFFPYGKYTSGYIVPNKALLREFRESQERFYLGIPVCIVIYLLSQSLWGVATSVVTGLIAIALFYLWYYRRIRTLTKGLEVSKKRYDELSYPFDY